ncbi:MAG: type I-B CRISPR-associated protein Cas8b1/Cst1 [Candidatus Rehaiarchaeum fermentans]|nr:type I-B CRISPR-associated protein Cas8b1/Cst1 [Candidatus Rehaiarchaeum fermentans]
MKIFHNYGVDDKVELFPDHIEFDDNILTNFEEMYIEFFKKRYYQIYEGEYIGTVDRLIYIMDSDKINDHEKELDNALGGIKDFYKKLKNKFANSQIVEETKNDYDVLIRIKSLRKNASKQRSIANNEEIANIKKIMEKEEVKKQFFIDWFKSILSGFFGQASFLNISAKAKVMDEIKSYIKKDYLDPLKNLVEKTDKECSLCGLYEAGKRNFDESKFLPLGASIDNAQNMFWKEAKYPICDLCNLIMFCTPAGSTYYKGGGESTNIFVNMDEDLNTLYDINYDLSNKADRNAPYKEIIINTLSKAQLESRWTLNNILFIEFNAEFKSKKSIVKYFDIPSYLSNFFVNYSDNSIKQVGDRNDQFKAIDLMLQNKSLNPLIFSILHDEIAKKRSISKDAFFMTKSQGFINACKKGDDNAVELTDKELQYIFRAGCEIHDKMVKDRKENKINSIAYRLLNAIKVGDIKMFMDTLIRLYMNLEEPIPRDFLKIADKESFTLKGQAFIEGLIFEGRYNENKNEEVNSNEE